MVLPLLPPGLVQVKVGNGCRHRRHVGANHVQVVVVGGILWLRLAVHVRRVVRRLRTHADAKNVLVLVRVGKSSRHRRHVGAIHLQLAVVGGILRLRMAVHVRHVVRGKRTHAGARNRVCQTTMVAQMHVRSSKRMHSRLRRKPRTVQVMTPLGSWSV